jgi:hypothetical protein
MAQKTKLGKPPCNDLFTPAEIVSWLPPIDFDPSWHPESVTEPRYFYDITSDGLDPTHPWNRPDVQVIFSNPPYQNMKYWVYRMVMAALHESRPQVWALIQSMPGEPYWTHYIWPYARCVGHLAGRLRHTRPAGIEEEKSGGSFNSSLILFDQDNARADAAVGQVLARSEGSRHAPVFVAPVHRLSADVLPPHPDTISRSRLKVKEG